MLTYRLQAEPFVHLDFDVFLWLPLPERLMRADVFAQNPEPFVLGKSWYQPERVESMLAGVGGWLPDEWRWFRAARRALRSEACGLLGGNRVDFIRYVYDRAFAVIEHRANRVALATTDTMRLTTLLEEFLLAACLEYHHARTDSPFRSVTIAYLLESGADVFNPERAARAGYTHLLAGAKRNPAVAKLLEERIRRDDPAQFERCRQVARRWALFA